MEDRIPGGCSTTIKCVVRKVATVEGRLVCFEGNSTMEM